MTSWSFGMNNEVDLILISACLSLCRSPFRKLAVLLKYFHCRHCIAAMGQCLSGRQPDPTAVLRLINCQVPIKMTASGSLEDEQSFPAKRMSDTIDQC